MLRKGAIAAAVAGLLLLAGCMGASQEPAYDVTRTPYDAAEGERLLLETERCVIDLLDTGGGSREKTLAEFQKAYGAGERVQEASSGPDGYYTDVYDGGGWYVWSSFFNLEQEQGETLPLVESGLFFPTIYHEGVDVAEVYLEKTIHKDEADRSLDREYLVVKELYTGSDPLLEGFHRENYYVQDGAGWKFDHLGGMVNIAAEGLDFCYLPRKEGV